MYWFNPLQPQWQKRARKSTLVWRGVFSWESRRPASTIKHTVLLSWTLHRDFKLSTLYNIEGMWLCRVDSPADWLCCGLCHSVTGSMWGMVWMITSFWKVMCNRFFGQGRSGYWKYRLTGSTGLKQYLTTLTEDKANLISAELKTHLFSLSMDTKKYNIIFCTIWICI